MGYILYIAACLFLFIYAIWHTRQDDDVTVSDAILLLLMSFVPPLNGLMLVVIVTHRFSASGSDFSDRVLIPQRRK